MVTIFFKDLKIPKPNYNLNLKNKTGITRVTKMIESINRILNNENPDICIVMGDVFSTLAGSIAASYLELPIVHIEAGVRGHYPECSNEKQNRSKILRNPEEKNRIVSDSLSNLLLTVSESGRNNLISEGYPQDIVFNTGDLMYDTYKKFVDTDLPILTNEKDFLLVTIHRAENTDNKIKLSAIIESMVESKKCIYFPIHPRTKAKLEEYKLLHLINNEKNINTLGPLGYFDFLSLLKNCSKVLTDSGGVRREAYFFGKPVINCSPIVWFPEIIETGWKIHVGPNKESILKAVHSFNPAGVRPNIFGDGKSAIKIVNHIIEFFNK